MIKSNEKRVLIGGGGDDSPVCQLLTPGSGMAWTRRYSSCHPKPRLLMPVQSWYICREIYRHFPQCFLGMFPSQTPTTVGGITAMGILRVFTTYLGGRARRFSLGWRERGCQDSRKIRVGTLAVDWIGMEGWNTCDWVLMLYGNLDKNETKVLEVGLYTRTLPGLFEQP